MLISVIEASLAAATSVIRPTLAPATVAIPKPVTLAVWILKCSRTLMNVLSL